MNEQEEYNKYLKEMNEALAEQIRKQDRILNKSQDREETDLRYLRMEALICMGEVKDILRHKNLSTDNKFRAERLSKRLTTLIDAINSQLGSKDKGTAKSVIYKSTNNQAVENNLVVENGRTYREL